MAGNDPEVTSPPDPALLARFVAAYAPLDDDALASMANRGLVRRAAKDLEKSPPTLGSAVGDTLTLTLDGQTVRLALTPAQSTCTCASGVCRHILTCVLHLRQMPVSSPASASEPATPATVDPQELLSLTDEALEAAFGKAMLTKARRVALREMTVTEGSPLIVSFPGIGVSVRFLPAGGVAGSLCSCHAPAPCEHRVGAVLAYQIVKGTRTADQTIVLKESTGAPRTREEVRASTSALVVEIVFAGLSRLSQTSVSRARTLSTSAHGVDLPRLSRQLKSLATMMDAQLRRDAAVDATELLLQLARTHALVTALASPLPHLVGQHRSRYEPVVAEVRLTGVGAKQWRSRSGYEGVSVYFWDETTQRFSSWTDARPTNTPGFNPRRRFDEDGPWTGSASPRRAAETTWRLTGLHRNSAGRVTARPNSRGVPVGPTNVDALPHITDFAQLAPVIEAAFAPGLVDRDEHAAIVLLKPTAVLKPVYDPVQQIVRRPLMDANGRTLVLALEHSAETDQALTTLRDLPAEQVQAVLIALHLRPESLVGEPITLWTPTGPRHLTVDTPLPKHHSSAQPPPPPSEPEDPDDIDLTEEELPPPAAANSPVSRLLTTTFDLLTASSEAGVGPSNRYVAQLRQSAAHCRSLGLSSLSVALTAFTDAVETYRKSSEPDPRIAGQALLRAAYLTRLALDAHSLAAIVG